MKNRGLLIFLIILLLGWIIFGSWYLSKRICNTTENTAPAVSEEVISNTQGLVISDGSNFSASANQGFFFNRDEASVSNLENGLETTMRDVASYLKDNANRMLVLNGLFTESEEQPALFPDLGFARANTIKEYLETLDVDPAQLTTASELVSDDKIKDGILENGISFSFSEANPDTDARLERIREEVLGRPLTINFASADASLNLDQAQKEDLSDMIYYLDRVTGSYLEIGGHTDNQGTKSENEDFSRQRARSVREYVAQGGIAEERMKIVGYGQDKPIASNKYADGRHQNRRAEIILLEE